MVIMTEHHFTLNRRGLLGATLATSAALTFGGSPYAMAAPIRRPRLTVPKTLAVDRRHGLRRYGPAPHAALRRGRSRVRVRPTGSAAGTT